MNSILAAKVKASTRKTDAALLTKLRCSSLPMEVMYAGMFLESAISSEVLKVQWHKTCLKENALSEVLFNGWWSLKTQADDLAAMARERGQLLFAFAGTTVLEGGAA